MKVRHADTVDALVLGFTGPRLRPRHIPVIGRRDSLDRRIDIGEELQEEGAALGVRAASAVADLRVRVLQDVPADVGGRAQGRQGAGPGHGRSGP
ncbi:hypothetical protein OG887_44770 (plasmid) [Streptomyces sp. NBC_00053]|uniref:hypothetical protein n=1 Tax=unclassified Streptomyces TaxID=2593676 RepID=UPI002258A33F|nr:MULTISPECIES: hypothetical protein [unclassified Streptomyces]MCX4400210.1 hypothetical protein [Streptomyces sp. NBC_01767]MCX5506089.1 hypothetical protein [Streptomyces sp. NBC_00052]MCX5554254.1 hypothetical protein [Streptomyces sp. NBC_00051]WSP52991.1 hypothetical protein OG348_45955 [Streptomyces sp. NBC_01243]